MRLLFLNNLLSWFMIIMNKDERSLIGYLNILFLLMLCLFSTVAFGDSLEDMAKKAQNPLTNINILPIQNNTSYGMGPYNRTANTLNIEPVIPFALNDKWNLITKTIIPIISNPNINHPNGRTTGLGDVNPSFYFAPKSGKDYTIGFGPSFFLPTATQKDLGTGKWSAGPGAVFVVTPGHWVIGSLVNQVWSFAGQSDRPHFSQMTWQPFVNRNFGGGWYLTTSPIVTSVWSATAGNRWTLPAGGGGGKVWRVSNGLYMNIDAQVFYSILTPDSINSRWGSRLEFKLLFP